MDRAGYHQEPMEAEFRSSPKKGSRDCPVVTPEPLRSRSCGFVADLRARPV